MSAYNEDNLVQKTTADHLVFKFQWNESVLALHGTLGLAGTLGRIDESEVVLVRYLRVALKRLNPGLPDGVYEDAVRILKEVPAGAGWTRSTVRNTGCLWTASPSNTSRRTVRRKR